MFDDVSFVRITKRGEFPLLPFDNVEIADFKIKGVSVSTSFNLTIKALWRIPGNSPLLRTDKASYIESLNRQIRLHKGKLTITVAYRGATLTADIRSVKDDPMDACGFTLECSS